MKKTLFCLAVLTAALVSCQKNEMPASEEVQGIPMTLTASLSGELGTKATVTPDANGLKTTWDATESISVVTLDGSGDSAKLVSVDTFTSSGTAGRADAEFTGTFTGGATPAKVIVIYPALEEQTDGSYKTPTYNGAFDSGSILAGLKVGSDMFTNDSKDFYLRQTADNNCDHFKDYCVMTGNVDLTDIQSNKLSVKMRNLTTVIKLVLKFPDYVKGLLIDDVQIQSFQPGDDARYIFHAGGWTPLDLDACGLAFPGSAGYNQTAIYASFNVPDTGNATFYLPIAGMDGTNEAGDVWEIAVQFGDDTFITTLTFPDAITYEAGKVYTANVAF